MSIMNFAGKEGLLVFVGSIIKIRILFQHDPKVRSFG
jgi:hypothetical protein